tara:strand:- start:2900 stop:3613 length:714 start_codon:yes stop_codon:yes gene_type:complete
MANWRQKVVDWDHEDADWGGESQIHKASKDAQPNISNLSLYGKGGCLIDLGSNIGEFAKEASKFFDKVFCYEAHPISYEVSVKRLKGIENVSVENLAVWKESGKELFASTPENSIGATVREKKFYPNRKEGYYKKVQSVSFNSLMEKHRPRVLKTDVEGCEYEIFPEADFNEELEYVSVEFHQPFVSPARIEAFKYCIANFKSQGFEILSDVDLTPRKLLYFTIIFERKSESATHKN